MTNAHILVIDDNAYIVGALKSYLELLGYRVTHADGCQQAKEKLRIPDKVDLIILDYLMHDGSGIDLLRWLCEEKSLQRPPVIISSGILDHTAPIWAELRKRLSVESQSLIQAYVSKPYTLDAMDVALQEVLGGDYFPDSQLTPRTQKT